jgi:hypothetical protein
MSAADRAADRPVLVGGTGRSGSTIVGHILDHHPSLTLTRPMEVRFITGNDGLADALRVALEEPGSERSNAAARLAVARIHDRWFERAENVGLYTSLVRAELTQLCESYLEDFESDALEATRVLTKSIMFRVAASIGADRWVDTTPANARKADRVEPIYPESKVIIVNRDGRDVAASFVQQSFGPDDVFAALDQWEQRMLRIHKAVARSRPDRILQIDLVDLVTRDRIGTLERVCAAIDVPLDAQMVEWFDENVTAHAAHGGRWRQDFDQKTCDRLDEVYADMCGRLSTAGVRIPPSG